jgi:hypothetical protein
LFANIDINGSDSSLAADRVQAYGTDAAFEESDMNWQTRELLEQICASVSNVVEDASLDFNELFADDLFAA